MENPGEQLNNALLQASKSLKDFHKELYKTFNKSYSDLQKVSDPEDFANNEHLFFKVPDELNADFVNLVTVGSSLKQAYEILKDTYKFEDID